MPDLIIGVRLPADLLARLDALEARERGTGRRDVNRSSIMRDALTASLKKRGV